MQTREQNKEFLFILIAFLLAIFLRFIQLGASTLNNAEATLALQAMHLANGSATQIAGQPGYLALTAALFNVFSATDFLARFWPAVFGSLLVLVPLLFKKWLGLRPEIILVYLFALDPGLVAISRSAGAEAIAITCTLAALGFALNKKAILAGIAAGLAILAGTPLWLGILTFGIALIAFKWIVQQPVWDDSTFISGKDVVSALIAAFLTIGLLGTLFGIHPVLLSGLGSGISEFLALFTTKAGISILVLILGLILSEALVFPFAVWGVASGPEQKNKFAVLMIFWTILLILFTLLMRTRQMVNWGWMLIALNSLAMVGLETFFTKIDTHQWKLSLVQATITFALVVFSYLNLIALVSNPGADQAALRNQVLAIVLPLVMVFIVTMLIGWGWSFIPAKQGLLAGLAILLCLVSLGNSWKSAGLGPRPESELWPVNGTPVGAKDLLTSVEDISMFQSGEKTAIDVKLVGLNDPALQWLFRDFAGLKSDDVLINSDTSSIIISKPDTPLNLNNLYRGQLFKWKAQVDYSQMDGFDWIKWFSMREVPLVNENLLLWARNDLFKGSE